MKIRKAQVSDIEKLIQNRIEFFTYMECNIPEGYEDSLRAYLKNHLGKNTFVCLLAEENDDICSIVMMSVLDCLPNITAPTGKQDTYNVYTKQPYRRQGTCCSVITTTHSNIQEMGIDKIMLDYTDDGYPLYCKLEFQKLDRQMALSLCTDTVSVG